MSVKECLADFTFRNSICRRNSSVFINGEVFDVAIDPREGSETYGKWQGELLTEENKKQFLIPRGFAHGFLALNDTAEFCYECDDFYHPNDEGGLA